jgi:hypothetical protein
MSIGYETDLIKDSDISVVVQGPIVGSSNDSIEKRFTLRCLRSIREYLPQAEIILSTWENSDLVDLDYDILVENEDPGTYICNDVTNHPSNLNRMLVSTKEGILRASKPYTMKLRADTVLTGTGFIDLFGVFNERCTEWKILKKRVLTTIATPNPRKDLMCFHPCDWFFFGLTEDVLNIWDIPLAEEPEHSRFFKNAPKPFPNFRGDFLDRYVNEQYLWLSFLRKYGEIKFDHYADRSGNYALEYSELTISNNLMVLPFEALGIECLKYPASYIESNANRFFTFDEFMDIYEVYCVQNMGQELVEKTNGQVNFFK